MANALIDTLKRALKAHGLTYADVATSICLSEASVKRMFSKHNFTLERMDTICQMMDMDMADLVRMFESDQHRISHLTFEQEQELVSDIKLLLIALCVRDHMSFDDILQRYDISKSESFSHLVRLDRLKLIELLPNNRIKLLIARDFRWLPNGPIERFFENKVQNEFLNSRFKHDDELRLYLGGLLSRSSHETLLKKLKLLANEFTALQEGDIPLPLAERSHVSLFLAMRHWELAAFAQLRRNADTLVPKD